MAQMYCTGPCEIFVGPFNHGAGAAVYLGVSEEAPEVDVQSRAQGAKASLGGNAVDFDTADQGQEAFVSFLLTRWNETVLQQIINMPDPTSALGGTAPAPLGTYVPGGLGTLAMLEQQGITLFLQFPYSAKPAMIAGGPSGAGGALRSGYRFPFAKLVSENYPRNGTGNMAVAMAYHCLRTFDPTAGANSYGIGQFVLYDFALSGLPQIN